MTKILMILFNEILIPLHWKARNRHNYTIIYKFFFIFFFDNNCCYNRSNKKSPKVTVKATVSEVGHINIANLCESNIVRVGPGWTWSRKVTGIGLDWTGQHQ